MVNKRRNIARVHFLQRRIYETVIIQPTFVHGVRPRRDNVSRVWVLLKKVLQPFTNIRTHFLGCLVQAIDQYDCFTAV